MLKTILHFTAMTAAIAGVGLALVMGAAEAATPTGTPPACSKTLTDNCIERAQAPRTSHPAQLAHHRSTKA
jgi:hypothetical protein